MAKIIFFLSIVVGLVSGFTTKYFPFTINHKCDQVLHKKAFDVCYSYKKKEPDFVVYTLKGSLVNKNNYTRKHNHFTIDFSIPKKYRAYPRDYSHEGYDRGHNAENASFDYNKTIQKETFKMSNIAPQAKWLNRRYWAKVEDFSRKEALNFGQVDVITGNCGSKGVLHNNVNIPSWWFKIIYIPSEKKFISFLAPNTNKGMKSANIDAYRLPVVFVELICHINIKEPHNY